MDNNILSKPQDDPVEPRQESVGLVDALLDLSFRTAITPKIVRVLYIVGLIAAALFAGRWALPSFDRGIMGGMTSLIFAPILFVLYALITRMMLEVLVAVFRILEHLKSIDRKTR